MILWDPRFRPWLEARVGEIEKDAQFIGRMKDSRIVAVVAFSHYFPSCDISLSCAGEPGSASRGFLDAIFHYVFKTCDLRRCSAKARASNLNSQRLVKRLGFEQEGIQRFGYGDEDAVLFGLLRENYGKRRRKTTTGSRSRNDPGAAEPVQPHEHGEPVRLQHMEYGSQRA